MFDRFDICMAYYCYAMQYHYGQWSSEYRVFGRLDRIRFRPSILFRDEDDLSENARYIYDRLVSGEARVRGT